MKKLSLLIPLFVLMVGLFGCKSSLDTSLEDAFLGDQFQKGPLGELTDLEAGVTINPLSTYTYLYHINDAEESKQITLPETFADEYIITAINEFAFESYTTLETIYIPDSYEYISMYAFLNCNALKNIEIGSGLQTMDPSAFALCNAVEKVVISESNPYLYSKNNCIIQRKDNKLIRGFSTSTIPDDITCIGMAAFSETNLTDNFVIPLSVQEIQTGAFGYTNLTKMLLPDSVTVLGDSVWGHCDSLEYVYIPQSVLIVGETLFKGSNSSQITVYCEAESKPEGWSNDWLKDCDNVSVFWGYKLDIKP